VTKNSDLKKLVTKAAIRRVPIDALAVDPSYQREVRPGHSKIVANFDETAFGVPLIGEREDCTLWIVDGLQRITAIKKLGHDVVRCEVFASKGPEHEAEVFKLVNLNRTRLRPFEEFKALLTSHDKAAWEIKKAVEDCGMRISGSFRDKDLSCISTLRYMHKHYGSGSISFALNTVKEAWPGDLLSLRGEMLQGLGMFYAKYDGLVEKERLLPRLRTTTAQKILFRSRQLSTSNGFAGEICASIDMLYKKRVIGRPRGF
jgi:hypothetical protein